ncbi:MAG TPA: hypothetical protein VED47_03660 [Burkholderiaceae bacterium]|nr:hypothetical protein [Burkholderiaceae bacterium]
MRPRPLLLGGALVVSFAWSAWALFSPQEEVVQPAARNVPAPSGSARVGSGAVEHDASRAVSASTGPDDTMAQRFELPPRPQAPSQLHNLFAAYSYEAPRPIARLAAPEPPHAPPLPFVYAGRLIVGGQSIYLLSQAGAPITATLGTEIGEFKLVQTASDRLVFLHGPTGQEVPMTLGPSAVN